MTDRRHIDHVSHVAGGWMGPGVVETTLIVGPVWDVSHTSHARVKG